MTETVDSTALTFEGVHDVHSSNGLTFCVLAIEGGILADAFEEITEGLTRLVVDEARQTLDTTTTR